jgi:hypothetical protein
MESVVYRNGQTNAWKQELHAGAHPADSKSAGMVGSACDGGTLSPDLFYPLVTGQEMITWTHWLPTSIVFDCAPEHSHAEVMSTLTRLKAPPEVVEEFQWSWKMGMFETYEVRTPVRQDARDPLLLGRVGGQAYRLVLWGESVLPLERITALVQQSLTVRAQAASRRVWFGIGGSLLGLVLALWLGYQLREGQAMSAGPLLGFLFFFLAWLPMLMYTPENCQHDFLDRYRR